MRWNNIPRSDVQLVGCCLVLLYRLAQYITNNVRFGFAKFRLANFEFTCKGTDLCSPWLAPINKNMLHKIFDFLKSIVVPSSILQLLKQLLFLTLIGILATSIFFYIYLPITTNHGDTLTVPNITGVHVAANKLSASV